MKTAIRKTVLAILCIAVMVVAASCSSDENKKGTGAPITSKWEYYCVTHEGATEYHMEGMDDSMIPHFSSEDGKNYTLTITGSKYYSGEMTMNNDGSYELHNGNNPNTVHAVIQGNKLTLTIKKGSTIVFTTKLPEPSETTE